MEAASELAVYTGSTPSGIGHAALGFDVNAVVCKS